MLDPRRYLSLILRKRNCMPIISLTSDYGTVDHRVACIKGSLLSMNEDIKLVDITHDILPYNIQQAAYVIRSSYKSFPEGSIHIICVDSFFHKDRKNILVKIDGHYFLAADNGILNLIFFDIKPDYIFEITLNKRFDDTINFTATDIFVPAAIHLYNGGVPEVIGKLITETKETYFVNASYKASEKMIIGEVMYVDNFGNVVSNIHRSLFELHMSNATSFIIKFRNIVLTKIYNQYTDLVADWNDEAEYHGKSAVIFNDNNLLELTVYKGSLHNGAASLFGMNMGEKIYIEFDS